MQSDLKGRTIVVIGGTSGIGLAAARALAGAGARLVCVGHEEASSAEAAGLLGDCAEVFTADATSPATAERAIERAVAAGGRLNGLLHVAGGSGRSRGDGPLDTITDEGWDFTLGLNLRSVFLSNRAAVRRFLGQGDGGSVLNLSSVLAHHPAAEHFSTHAYAAAKAGVEGLTRAAAARYARDNIRFNALAPGLVATPMSARARTDPAIMAYVRRKQPLGGGRIGEPEDLAAVVVFFLSDASRFVTGQVLAVDGGWSVTEAGGGKA